VYLACQKCPLLLLPKGYALPAYLPCIPLVYYLPVWCCPACRGLYIGKYCPLGGGISVDGIWGKKYEKVKRKRGKCKRKRTKGKRKRKKWKRK
jgi:hypothetical protein